MCFFQKDNLNVKSKAYELGVTKFDCGVCPECLSKKARLWSLRCGAEAQENTGVMVTLTYDTYKYNNSSLIENPVNPNLLCNVKHCQKFLKRLRKHFKDKRIKYLLCAEHGTRTNRAHYHAILFGIQFDDIVPLKRSKRGNLIYKSSTLEKIWSHGICTVDAISISGKIARYCTKYCAKDTRCDDTFMLFSRGIGDKWLLDNFNAKSYIVDGVEYPIPKLIWNKYIEMKINKGFNKKRSWFVDGIKYHIPYDFRYYSYTTREMKLNGYFKYAKEEGFFETNRRIYKNARRLSFLKTISCKYRSCMWFYEKYKNIKIAESLFFLSSRIRNLFAEIKRRSPEFQSYLDYWKNKAEIYELNKPSDLDRIRALPDDKYFSYKNKAIQAKIYYEQFGNCIVPRSRKTSLLKWKPICPLPLVNKGQMTPSTKKNIKTVFWKEAIQDFVYLRPLKSY